MNKKTIRRRRIKGGVDVSRSRSRGSRSRSRSRPRSRSRTRIPSTPSALLINNQKITSFVGEPPLKPNVNQGVASRHEEEAARVMRAYNTAINNYRTAIHAVLREKGETDRNAKVNNIRKHQLSKELGIGLPAAGRKEVAERRRLASRR
jgi:hypothetical protein